MFLCSEILICSWFKDGKTTLTQQGGLGLDAIKQQVGISLQALKAPRVNLLYLHAPDHQTPLIDSLRAIHELHTMDKFDEWGLSNFPSWQGMDILVCYILTLYSYGRLPFVSS